MEGMIWRILVGACSAFGLFVVFKLVRVIANGNLERSRAENRKVAGRHS